MTPTITLTDALVNRIKTLRVTEKNAALNLRVSVTGGGCQGFSYDISLTETTQPDDALFTKEDVTVLVDSISLPFLAGAEIDYVETLMSSQFEIRNPNARSSCGCGTSFSV